MQIAALDWMLMAVLLLSLALGAWRGLVYEVMSVMGWVAAFVLAQIYAARVGQSLPIDGVTDVMRYASGFVLTFVVCAFSAGLLAWLTKKLIETVGLRPVDRTLGAVFGALRAMVILLAAATVVLMTPLKEKIWWKQSVGAAYLSATLKAIKPILPPELSQYIQSNSQGIPSPLGAA
jgi:membrane protein required for colicin V production